MGVGWSTRGARGTWAGMEMRPFEQPRALVTGCVGAGSRPRCMQEDRSDGVNLGRGCMDLGGIRVEVVMAL